MIKKEAFLEVEGFKLDGKGLWEDWILWLKLLAKGHFPIHMSYYGFWYRKKKEGSELSKASSKENYNNNMKMIKSYADKIIEDVIPIQFPRYTYKWDGISEVNEDFIVPSFKKSKKTNILVIVPWMTLGGADKFNLDLFKLINKDKYSITLVTTQPTQYIWRQEFEEHCDAVYDLSSFIDHKDWVAFMNYIIESRGIDIIFNTNSVSGYMMLPYLKAKHPDIPIMDYIHMEEWYNRNGGYSRDSAAVSSVIDRTLFCNGGSQKIMNEYFGIDKEKLNTVYIGVDAEKFDPSKYDKEALRKKYELSSEQFVIGLISRIDYQKRPYLLMRIIEETVKSGKIKNPLFLVAGGGPLLDDIKKIAKTKKLENFVKFLGVSKTPDEIYAVSDVTLNCSIKEGLALTAYESLSMGVPVVSCDVGGQKELINEQTGVIVPCLQDEKDIYDFDYSKEDVNNYVVGLEKIYSNLDKYKSKCRKRILESFTIQNMVVNMEKEFDALLKIKKDYNFLSNNVDIYKELLNEYFLAVEKEYFWLCIDYYQKNYGVDLVKYNDSINNTRSKRRNSLNIREKLWQIGAWRWFVKTPIWKLGRKIVKGK